MIRYIENLERFGFPLEKELAANLILQLLLESFSIFVFNINTNNMDNCLSKLLGMLKTVEQNLKSKGKTIMIVRTKGPPSRVVKGNSMKYPKLNLLFML